MIRVERVALPTELNKNKRKLSKIISRLSSKPMDNMEFIEQAKDEFNTPSDIKEYVKEGNKLIKDQKLGKPEADLTPTQEKKLEDENRRKKINRSGDLKKKMQKV